MKQGKELYPLTSAQMSLVMSQIFSIEPLTVREANMLGVYFMVPENCNFDALEKAFNRVIEQNDSLRLRIVRKGLGFYQYIEDYRPRRLDVVTIDNTQEAIEAYKAQANKHLVKLFNNDLVWAQMARFGTGGILFMRFNHMCTDGYSLSLTLKALERYYDCCAAGEALPEEKTYSVTKYFEGTKKYLGSKQLAKDKAFWKQAFYTQRDYKFPLGRRSELSACASEKTVISGDLYQKLCDFCAANKCTMQTAVMSLAAIQIYAGTGARNFGLCSVSHNRTTPALKQTMGCMMESCLTFIDIDTSMSINEFAQDTYINNLTHLSHGRIPITEQNRYIFKESVKHGFNFYHQWLIFSNMDLGQTISELKYPAGAMPRVNNVIQIYCNLFDVPGQSLTVAPTYQTHKFKKEQVQDMLEGFRRLAEVALDDPTRSVEEVAYRLQREGL